MITMKKRVKEVLDQLRALGDAKIRSHAVRQGAGDDQFGVRLGDIRKMAKKIGPERELAMALWETGNVDARLLSVLLLRPKMLSATEVDQMVRSLRVIQVADWLNAYVIKDHPDKETLRLQWMDSTDPMSARSGWGLTAERVAKNPDGLDVVALLDRIELELADAGPEEQWTMNYTLAKIGIHCVAHRARAVAIGEKLGVYRDYPVSKGCTSPFAPAWIDAIVGREA